MKSTLAAIVLLIASVGGARASAYLEFVAGLSELGRNNALSGKHFSAALDDPKLASNLKPIAYLDRANIYVARKQLGPAMADLTASLSLRPSFIGYVQRALIFIATQKVDSAVQDASAAIALRPDLALGYEFRAGIQLGRRDLGGALSDLTYATALVPDGERDFELRSAVYRYKGDFASSLKDAETAITLSSSSIPALFAKVKTYEAEGDLADALTTIDLILQKRPRDPSLLRNKGFVLWEFGRFSDAAQIFDQAQQLEPGNGYGIMWSKIARADAHLPDSGPIAAPSAPSSPPTTSDDAQQDTSPSIKKAPTFDPSAWPGPLVRVYQGSLKQSDVMPIAVGDPQFFRARVCEANFYLAQWNRLQGAVGDLKSRLEAVVADCPFDFIERPVAMNELRALK